MEVKVGDHVTKGQVLASVDAFPYRQALAQAQGQLKQQQAALGKATSSPVVQGTQDSLAQAQAVLEATKNQADATAALDDTAIDRAKKQLDFDEHTLDQAEHQLDSDQDACGILVLLLCLLLGHSSSSLMSTAVAAASAVTTNPACSAVTSDKSAVTAAKRAVVADKTALASAQKKKDVDEAAGELAVANAQQAVVSAQNNAASASSDRPFTIDGQAGSSRPRRPLSRRPSTTWTTPRSAPRPTARWQRSTARSASSSPPAPAPRRWLRAATRPSRVPVRRRARRRARPRRRRPPGGSQFLVLDDIREFQLVAPFGESDATQITPAQKVDITLDAIPDLTPTGTVLSVAPTGTAISGVISYYVTITVDGSDPRLKDGLTAHAAVITNEIDNVLTVPNAAVRKDAGKSTVTVLGADGSHNRCRSRRGSSATRTRRSSPAWQEGQQVVLPAGQ